MRPYFIGIGTYKAGTSWISRCLSEHPSLFIPIKESYFFIDDVYWRRGAAWYEIFFRDCRLHMKAGEFCSGYLHDDRAPQRIASLYPESKIVISLRNPIERAFSHYLHEIRYGALHPSISFRAAIAMRPYYLQYGLYATALRRYYDAFPQAQIHISLYEDGLKRPAALIAALYDFLGVDALYKPPSLFKTVHGYRNPRFTFLESRASGMWLAFMRFAARHHMHGLVQIIRESFLIPLFFSINSSPSNKRPSMSEDDRKFLAAYFKEDIRVTEGMLGMSLAEWH